MTRTHQNRGGNAIGYRITRTDGTIDGLGDEVIFPTESEAWENAQIAFGSDPASDGPGGIRAWLTVEYVPHTRRLLYEHVHGAFEDCTSGRMAPARNAVSLKNRRIVLMIRPTPIHARIAWTGGSTNPPYHTMPLTFRWRVREIFRAQIDLDCGREWFFSTPFGVLDYARILWNRALGDAWAEYRANEAIQ